MVGSCQKKMYSYSSCAKSFIHFCACAGECLLKKWRAKILEKNCNYPAFYVKCIVIGNRADLDVDIWIKFYVVFVIRIWIDIMKMHTSKLTKSLTSIVIFQYRLVRWCKLEINTIGRPSGIHTGYKQERLQWELKYDPHRFCHLK